MPDNDQLIDAAIGRLQRRAMFKKAGTGLAGAVAAAAVARAALAPTPAKAASEVIPPTTGPTQMDVNILNFALNLELAEAQFYANAVFGTGLSANDLAGGLPENVQSNFAEIIYTDPGATPVPAGNTLVPFSNPLIAELAQAVAIDELAHVRFIKGTLATLGGGIIAAPLIDVTAAGAFTTLATAVNTLIGSVVIPTPYNPYADDVNFLLAAFNFEDVGVTAYAGAAGLISMGSELVQYAASILAVEAYHSGTWQTLILSEGANAQADAIADLRSILSSGQYPGQALADDFGTTNPVTGAPVDDPRDGNGLAYRRSVQQILNIEYGNEGVNRKPGLFFPNGFNQLPGQSGFA